MKAIISILTFSLLLIISCTNSNNRKEESNEVEMEESKSKEIPIADLIYSEDNFIPLQENFSSQEGFADSQAYFVYQFSGDAPYKFGFGPEEDFSLVQIVNKSTPASSWTVSDQNPIPGFTHHARFSGISSENADDWLVSIPFNFKEGQPYYAEFHYATDGTNEQSLILRLGRIDSTGQNINFNIDVINLAAVKNKDYKRASGVFRVPESGNYFFSIQAYGLENGGYTDVGANGVMAYNGGDLNSIWDLPGITE